MHWVDVQHHKIAAPRQVFSESVLRDIRAFEQALRSLEGDADEVVLDHSQWLIRHILLGYSISNNYKSAMISYAINLNHIDARPSGKLLFDKRHLVNLVRDSSSAKQRTSIAVTGRWSQ